LGKAEGCPYSLDKGVAFMSEAYKLSPSYLTFLWNECPRCFYLKVVRGFDRPWSGLPRIFTQIDSLMTGFFQGLSTAEVAPELPEGVIQHSQRWVTSEEIALPGHNVRCYISGRFDTVVAFSDGTFGVVDYKTSRPKPEQVGFYSRQLHAYAYALENAAAGKLGLGPISRLGLLVYEPLAMERTADGRLAYLGDVTWLECPKDYDRFLGFLEEVVTVLEMPDGPPSSPECSWCRYREEARRVGL
jgi:hypothetical protein